MNHQKLVLLPFHCHDLKCNPLEVITEEGNSSVDSRVRRVPAPFDELNSRMLNDIKRALPRDSMLGR
jgi:hypothetical protein